MSSGFLPEKSEGFYFESVKFREVETLEALTWFGNRFHFNTVMSFIVRFKEELTFTREMLRRTFETVLCGFLLDMTIYKPL